MILVLDASVVLKWLFHAGDDEQDTEPALSILEALGTGRLRMVQPPHFLAEVAAVLVREKPDDAQTDLADFQEIDWEIVEAPHIYARAMELATSLQHHLFDTLYHATALSLNDAVLVTADRRYHVKAEPLGGIALLGTVSLSSS